MEFMTIHSFAPKIVVETPSPNDSVAKLDFYVNRRQICPQSDSRSVCNCVGGLLQLNLFEGLTTLKKIAYEIPSAFVGEGYSGLGVFDGGWRPVAWHIGGPSLVSGAAVPC
jgi:hypothetical protein